MDKLKGMTEYVLWEYEINHGNDFFKQYVINYAKFLSQPLTLGMFVPCSLEGEVLEEPEETDLEDSFFSMQKGFNEDKAYQAAKERVLFEGFEIEVYNPQGSFRITHAPSGFQIGVYKALPQYFDWVRESVDGLTKLPIQISLTESAKKKINAK